MSQTIQIVGDPDVYVVICETPTTKVLSNVSEKHRRLLAEQQRELALLQQQLGTGGRARRFVAVEVLR
jgi:hypothetical protein